MIETKEQYADWFPIDTACRIDWDESDINDVHETIEALRRFVRAHDAVENGTISFDLQHNQVRELSDSREELPDWITDG